MHQCATNRAMSTSHKCHMITCAYQSQGQRHCRDDDLGILRYRQLGLYKHCNKKHMPIEQLTISAGSSKLDETPDVELAAESPERFKRPSEPSIRSTTPSSPSNTGRDSDRLSACIFITNFSHY